MSDKHADRIGAAILFPACEAIEGWMRNRLRWRAVRVLFGAMCITHGRAAALRAFSEWADELWLTGGSDGR